MKRSQVMIAATFIALYGCFAVSMSVSDEAIGLPPGLPEPGGGRVLPPAAEPVHREQVDDPYQPGPPRSPGARSTARSMWTRGPYTSVQVNVDEYGSNIPGDAANEPSIAIDPTDPSRMVIGWRQFDTVASDFRQAGWAYSHDGGHWWTFPGVLEPGVFRSDPVLDADADGNFYYQSISPGGASLLCHIFRSTDGGLSWEPPVFAYGGDKNWMAIDRTNGIGRGNIYAIWQRFFNCCDDQTFTRSTDGGASFIYPTHIPSSPTFGTLAVRPDGEVYAAGMEAIEFQNPSVLVVARSTDAQDPSVTPSFVTTIVDLGGSLSGSRGPNPGGLLGQVWVACDHSDGPNRGNVYVLCSVDPWGPDPLDVMFTRSTDGGQTWSAPVRINDDPPNNGAWQWFGTISVSPNGRIDVAWNDTRNDPTVTFSELYYSYSEDGGVTWQQNVPLSIPFNHFLGYPNQNKLGDYYDMISDDLGVSLAYAATFNGEQDVYFLRIGTFDCNANGIDDVEDIAAGTSQDCDNNEVPDECEPDEDCNHNGVQDICDIAMATSVDCQPNRVPDECEPDCNGNGTADSCDIAAGVSTDCNDNGMPDSCEMVAGVSRDCQPNGVLDECDIAAGSSDDCTANGVPDECEPDCDGNGYPDSCDIAAGRSFDCNGNGSPDDCDIASGFSSDANTNGVPDECDVQLCDTVWDGFPSNSPPEPFQFNQPMSDVDYNGDGIFWENPAGSAVIGLYGCEAEPPYPLDFSVAVAPPGTGDPEEGYVASEYFHTVDAELDCGARAYSLTFNARILGAYGDTQYDHKYDWEFFLYDADTRERVLQLHFTSTASLLVSASQRGKILVKNPAGAPAYLDTGVGLAFAFDPVSFQTGTPCFEIEVALDNRDGTVRLYIDGELKVETTPLGANARRLDYFHLQAVRNFAPTGGNVEFRLDKFDHCRIAPVLMNWPDCNDNCVDDYWDLANTVSYDCNGNAVPDVCEPGTDCNDNGLQDICDLAAGYSADCNTNGIPDACEPDCNGNGVPDDCDISGGSSADCTLNGIPDECEPDCNTNGRADSCDIAAGSSDDCNSNGAPDECDVAVLDCNANGAPDDCDIAAGTSLDCDGNRTPDECDVATLDCNSNGVPDACDIAGGTSDDCTFNGVPDECEPDCNNNGIADSCDIDAASSDDCNGNGTPDECDVASHDCNSNGVPDDCDITVGTAVDCNGNGVPDGCDLQQGASFDCNGNDVPDECELGIPNNCCERGHGPGCSDSDIEACVCAVDAWCCDVTWDGLCVDLVTGLGCGSCTGNDCNVNGIPDDCDLTIGSSGDCNSNGIPDECETDCNTNGVPDECDLAVGTSRDCNVDLILDECDIAAGTSFDCNANGVPDECGEDCNRNGLADECDVAAGSSADCNSNGTPDECEMAVEIVYEIRRAGLVDLPEDCGNGSVFNFDGIGCNLQPGFRWYDSGAAPVVAAEIEFNVGVECHGPDVVHETSLNGFAGVSYPATPRFCSCDLTPGVEVRVRAAADRYEVGGWNTFLITNPATCMGVIPNVEWGEGVYARIRVWHAAEKDCNTNSILDECELGGNDCNTNGVPDGCDIAGGTSADENGNGTPDECEPRLDIKPGSCPNPLNRGSHGVLPAALLGAVHVDAAVIDASSVRLSRADGIGGEVAPNEGPPGPHSVVEDVGTPFGGGGWCDCHGLDGDGIVDLSVHFRTDDLVEVLELNNLTNGDLLELVITGSLLDGTEFASGGDCILIVPPGNSNLNVESSLPGLFIEVTPPDVNSDGSGFANFQRVHVPSTVVTLTAPATRDGFAFAGWEIDGTPVPNVSGAVSVTLVQTETTAEAVYVPVSRSGVPAPSPIPVPRRVPRPVVR